jgi:hypothetical protein
MQSLINWTYGYQPYSDGEYLVLIKTPSGGTRISRDCYIPGDGWETYTDYVIEAYCAFEDIKSISGGYLFNENSHPVNNKTLRDFHLDITGSFCDDIKKDTEGKNIYENRHYVFLNKFDDYLRERYNVKFDPNTLQYIEK